MSNYNSLKSTIDANIKQNGNQEITGQILNSVLNAMVTTLGTGYQFAGVATIATNPGTPDAKVFYIANGKGTYEKFGGLEVTEDDVVVLYWDSAWHKVATGIASQEKLSDLCKASSSLNLNAWKGTASFYTLEQAISEIPYERRTTGFRLTFRLNSNRWQTAIFVVGDVSDQYWKNVNYWRIDNNIPVININDLLDTQTTYYTLREAIDLVPPEYRAGGAIITFRSDIRMRKTYQYLLGTADANWYVEENWLELYGDTNVAIKDFVFGGGSDLFMYKGYQIAKSDGSIQSADNELYACTPFLPVKKGVEIIGCEGGNASRCSFYDEEYQFISSLIVESTNGNNVKTILTDDNIPSNAIYFRATGSFIASIPSVSGFDSYSSLKSAALANEMISKAFPRSVNWMALGDSITEGYYSNDVEPFYHLDSSKSYCKYIAELNGWTLNNKAIGGTGYICKGPSGTNTNGKELVQTLDFSNVDLVTIAYGVNDWKYNMVLGSMEDSIDRDAIIPAMRYVIEKIIEKNPLTKIVVITPINCAVGGNESTNYGINFPFSNNGTLEDIFNAFVEVCKYYGIEYIDMTHSSIFNRKNLLTLLMDKVHPTIPALKAMGRELAAKIPFK